MEYPLEINLPLSNASDGTAEKTSNIEAAISIAFAYLDDLLQQNREEVGIVRDEKDDKRYRRLTKAYETLERGDNKAKLADDMRRELNNIDRDDINNLYGKAYEMVLSKIYDNFDEQRFECVPILSNVGTNNFAAMAAKKKPDEICVLGDGKVVFTQGAAQLYIEKYNAMKSALRPSTAILLDSLIQEFTLQNAYKTRANQIKCEVKIPLEEYAKSRGKTFTKSNIEKIYQEAECDTSILLVSSLKWEDRGKKKDNGTSGITIGIKYRVTRRFICFTFNPLFAVPLNESYIMFLPTKLRQLDGRNRNLYAVGRKMAEHYSNDTNYANGTNDILAVQTLLNVCNSLPTYEEVMQGNRHITERIIEPFEKILNTLNKECGYIWQYVRAGKKPPTKEQFEALVSGDYSTFESLYIQFDIPGMPDQTERRQRNTEMRERRKLAAEKKAAKKEKPK